MTEETRISIALERIATALETIAECEVKSVALSNKFADTNESLGNLLENINAAQLRAEKPPSITKREKFKLQSYSD